MEVEVVDGDFFGEFGLAPSEGDGVDTVPSVPARSRR
jgi:hypothetical protein